jgi:hypothetical protein
MDRDTYCVSSSKSAGRSLEIKTKCHLPRPVRGILRFWGALKTPKVTTLSICVAGGAKFVRFRTFVEIRGEESEESLSAPELEALGFG